MITNWKGFGGKWSRPNFKVLSQHSLEGLRKTTKTSIRIAGRRGGESNTGPLEYEVGMLNARPRRSVWSRNKLNRYFQRGTERSHESANKIAGTSIRSRTRSILNKSQAHWHWASLVCLIFSSRCAAQSEIGAVETQVDFQKLIKLLHSLRCSVWCHYDVTYII
jgi:hypothetical protein